MSLPQVTDLFRWLMCISGLIVVVAVWIAIWWMTRRMTRRKK